MAEDSVNIVVINGTARPENKTARAVAYVTEYIHEHTHCQVDVVQAGRSDMTRTTPPWQDTDTVPEHHELFEKADAYVVVVPEYNHGYPGELKLLLDSMFDEYNDKPCGICGVSAGPFGGSRVVEHIKPVLMELGMIPLNRAMYFSQIGDVLTEDGTPTGDSAEKLDGRMEKFVADVVWYARTLKHGRDNISR